MNLRQRVHRALIIEGEERTAMNLDIPNDIRTLHKAFKAKGRELVVVGGAIRDAYMGEVPKDWDLASDAPPDEVIKILNTQRYYIKDIKETGKAFFVIRAFTDNDEYEIATYRKDIYGAPEGDDGRRPKSVEITDIVGDMSRRDLTVNALYYDLDTNEVVDLVGGAEDLKNKRIRSVGSSEQRFGEDKIRILRAMRFAARLDGTIDDDMNTVLNAGVDMSQLAREVVMEEFLKGIKTPKTTGKYLTLLNHYNLLEQVFPGIIKGKVSEDTFMANQNTKLVVASLLAPFANPNIESQLMGLKYSGEFAKDVAFLINTLPNFTPDLISDMKSKRKNVKVSDGEIMEFARIKGLDERLIQAALSFKYPSVDGNEVAQKFGLQKKALGDKINALTVNNFRASL